MVRSPAECVVLTFPQSFACRRRTKLGIMDVCFIRLKSLARHLSHNQRCHYITTKATHMAVI
jgi:hypothetical protein